MGMWLGVAWKRRVQALPRSSEPGLLRMCA